MPRLFIGSFLDLPEAERISSIARGGAPPDSPGLRLLPTEKLHVTWLFLGMVKGESIPQISDKLIEVRTKLKEKIAGIVTEITYDHLELWPSADKARVAVLCPSKTLPEVSTIAAEIRASLAGFQESIDNYPQFKPHLTLYRISQTGNQSAIELLPHFENLSPVKQSINIDNIRLIESDGGYTIIA